MNVWIRISSVIEQEAAVDSSSSLELSAGTNISLYPSEEAARAAKEACGGIVLEVLARSLRGQIRFGSDVYLSRPGTEDDADDPAPRDAFVTAVFDGIPHEWDEEALVAKFEPPIPWFDSLEQELNVNLSQ
jgi:hypothetical protein